MTLNKQYILYEVSKFNGTI